MINIFEDSRTEDETGAVRVIFEGGLNITSYEARKKLKITDSAAQREEDRSAATSTQEHQKLEGKLKHRVN